jgi:hypothetical protein
MLVKLTPDDLSLDAHLANSDNIVKVNSIRRKKKVFVFFFGKEGIPFSKNILQQVSLFKEDIIICKQTTPTTTINKGPFLACSFHCKIRKKHFHKSVSWI